MANGHEAVEDLSQHIESTLLALISATSHDMKAALSEYLGTFRLWQGSFVLKDLRDILGKSNDVTIQIIQNLCSIAEGIIKSKYAVLVLSSSQTVQSNQSQANDLQPLMEHHSRGTSDNPQCQSKLPFLMDIARTEIAKSADPSKSLEQAVAHSIHHQQAKEATRLEVDEELDTHSDSSGDGIETEFDGLRLHLKLLMRFVPTMERVLASIASTRQEHELRATLNEQSNLLPDIAVTQSQADQLDLSSSTVKVATDEAKGKATLDAEKLPEYVSRLQVQDSGSGVASEDVPTIPKAPSTQDELSFRNLLLSLSDTPIKYEDPVRLREALTHVPIDRINATADAEHETLRFRAAAGYQNIGPEPKWDRQDCVIRALLHWFKREFFHYVNQPVCSVCHGTTAAVGDVPPTPDESARSAQRVEMYKCVTCGAFERFPRYSDVWVLMETRRGRQGEFASCFTMLCRAMGSQARWVWNLEDAVWTEVYSDRWRRWIHVDACEGLWNQPKEYTERRHRKMSYCVAFSANGATDVTRRYVRKAEYQRPRRQVPEAVLQWIVLEIRRLRRTDQSDKIRFQLDRQDEREERELRSYTLDTETTAKPRRPHSKGEVKKVLPLGDKLFKKERLPLPRGTTDVKIRQSSRSPEHINRAIA